MLHFNAGEQSQVDKGRKKQREPVGTGREEWGEWKGRNPFDKGGASVGIMYLMCFTLPNQPSIKRKQQQRQKSLA